MFSKCSQKNPADKYIQSSFQFPAPGKKLVVVNSQLCWNMSMIYILWDAQKEQWRTYDDITTQD